MTSPTTHRLGEVDFNARWDDLEKGFAADRYNGIRRTLLAWCPGLVDLGAGARSCPREPGLVSL